MLPTYAEDDVEAFEGDQIGDRYSCLLGLNPCLLLILLIMLFKDVGVDIYSYLHVVLVAEPFSEEAS